MNWKIMGIILGFSSALQAKEQILDRIVALVDSEPILYSEVREKIEHAPLVKVSDYPATESDDKFTRALNDAINYKLIMRQAEELEITVTDPEVEDQINRMLAESGGYSRDSLKTFLQQQGKTYETYKNDIRDQMIFMRFRGRVIIPRVKLTEENIQAYHLKKQGSTKDYVELRLRQLLVRDVDDPVIGKEKEKLAQQIYEKLQAGMPFEEAEKIYSNGQAQEAKVFKLRDLSQDIRSHLENLKVGDFTSPVKTPMGLIIFYCDDRTLTGSQEYLRQKKQLEQELRNVELVKQTNLWLKSERERSNIKIVKE